MKHIFAFLLLLFVPTVVLAGDDACTNPRDYNLDRRCYVTRGEKMEYPYNRIVRIGDVATGTIIGPNLILTCRSCVNPERYNTNHGDIEFYTSDNQRHIARQLVVPTEQHESSEWALLKTKDTFETPFLEVSDNHETVDLGQIGFSLLKVLSDKELFVVQTEYNKLIKKYGKKKITTETIQKIMTELDDKLQKHKCSSDKDDSCIKCDAGSKCIFNDFANMKKEQNCIYAGSNGEWGSSTCTAGDMGAPMVGNNGTEIKGISFTKNIFFTNFAKYNSFVLPKVYYENVMKYVLHPLYVRHPSDKW